MNLGFSGNANSKFAIRNQKNDRMIKLTNIMLILLLASSSCKANPEDEPKKTGSQLSIQWDKNTLKCVADEGGYPRMHRLNDGSLMIAYENRRGDVVIAKSSDKGFTWSDTVRVFSHFQYADNQNRLSCRVNVANPEFIQLPNNDILLACNLRPDKDEVFPFTIALKRSTDNGKTWSPPVTLYEAAPRFSDGCWEPAFLLLPNGTLQVYFANENPYQNSNEQEISMLSSVDGGFIWTKNPQQVSFRANSRDGMPVPVIRENSIYAAIEDNGFEQFKPFIVKTSIADNWKDPVLANSSNRYAALQKPLPATVYAGAPYLIHTSGGYFVLSYQTTENRTSNWENSTMEVVISKTGTNFQSPSQPFNVPLGKEAKWNSLTDLGNGHIAAVSSTNFNSSTIGVWIIKGEIIKK